jgi:hypothetical protein
MKKTNPTLGKLIKIFNKPKAKTCYKFYEDADDPWFIYIIKYDLKTNKSSQTSMVTAKDIPSWVVMLNKDGWQESENQ